MLVRNATRNVDLGGNIQIANTSEKRRTGLLKHQRLAPGEGLWITPCEAVHTFGMKFAIDVVFLDKARKILKVRAAMPRRRISACLRAQSVLELPAGTLEVTGTQAGDCLEFTR